MLSHPVLQSWCHHISGEHLPILKDTKMSAIKNNQCKTTRTHSFAHFGHSLLQANVPHKVQVSFSAPENLICERKRWVILWKKTQQRKKYYVFFGKRLSDDNKTVLLKELTGSTGLLEAQVMTVEMRINIFGAEKLPIKPCRAVRHRNNMESFWIHASKGKSKTITYVRIQTEGHPVCSILWMLVAIQYTR